MWMADPSGTGREEPEHSNLVYQVMLPDQRQLTAAGKGNRIRKNADLWNDMNQSNKKKKILERNSEAADIGKPGRYTVCVNSKPNYHSR